jgi:UDP-N-acetylglucosamine diphosphorylase/glucosamine-1-phosphate N-acetyltransferase
MSLSICLFEDSKAGQFYPITLTHPVYDLRCGILTLQEKWRRYFPVASFHLYSRAYLANLMKERNPNSKINSLPADGTCIFINCRALPDAAFVRELQTEGEAVFECSGELVAAKIPAARLEKVEFESGHLPEAVVRGLPVHQLEVQKLNYLWDVVNNNPAEIARDFALLSAGLIAGEVHPSAILENESQIHLGPGSRIRPGVILDAEHGPIYIGKNATVMANAVIEGPASVGDDSIIKVGAKIYEGTSIGEVCKVGGEVEESIFQSYSNKQHDGFLGHAYLGQWVNLGADTNNSDLKNNYGSVRVFVENKEVDSGSTFVGLFMGDHSKSAINMMFNTGTVIGPMSNIFGSGFPPKHVPSFSWGGAEGFVEHDLKKALATAKIVMARRKVGMTAAYEELFEHVFNTK